MRRLFIMDKISLSFIASIMLCALIFIGCSSDAEERTTNCFDLVRLEFTGKLAYETTDYVEDYWRVVGNTGFSKKEYLIADTLTASGYVPENEASDTDRITYRIEKRPIAFKTWEPVLYSKRQKS